VGTDEIRERMRELARRAGLGGVPPVVLGAGALLAGLAVVFALVRWWPDAGGGASGVAFESSPQAAGAASPASAAPSAEASAARAWVHVVGAVMHPGVYEVAASSRVADVIDAAGGLLGSAAPQAVNLARVVADGEQIVVPTADEFAAGTAPGAPAGGGGAVASGAGAGAGSGGSAPVNINTADAAALDTLPGVGPSTAAKIVAEREANGPFASPEDLGRVSGIGDKKLEQLVGLVCVR